MKSPRHFLLPLFLLTSAFAFGINHQEQVFKPQGVLFINPTLTRGFYFPRIYAVDGLPDGHRISFCSSASRTSRSIPLSKFLFGSSRGLSVNGTSNSTSACGNLSKTSRAIKRRYEYDIFISHSYRDRILVEALVAQLTKLGLRVFVDWIEFPEHDRSSPPYDELRKTMQKCRAMIFISTQQSVASRWCAWELGCFNCKKIVVYSPGSAMDYADCQFILAYPKLVEFNSEENFGVCDYRVVRS